MHDLSLHFPQTLFPCFLQTTQTLYIFFKKEKKKNVFPLKMQLGSLQVQ